MKSGIVSAYFSGYLEEYRRRGFDVVVEKVYFWEAKVRESLKWLALTRHLFRRDTVILLAQHIPTCSGPLAPFFVLAARWAGRRVVVVAHETPDTYAKHLSRPLRAVYYAYEAVMARLASEYVVHTTLHRDALRTITSRPVHVVPHPVPQVERLEAPRATWGFYGMVSHKKGVDLLLAAYTSLPAGTLPVLKIMGTAAPGDEAAFERLQASVPASHRAYVHFSGYVREEDKPMLFSDVALMIFPYRWISQSGALAETCVYRVPYLASDLPFFQDFQASHGCGRLFPAGDVQALASTLESLAREPLAIPESEFARLEDDLSFGRCADRLEALLRA